MEQNTYQELRLDEGCKIELKEDEDGTKELGSKKLKWGKQAIL